MPTNSLMKKLSSIESIIEEFTRSLEHYKESNKAAMEGIPSLQAISGSISEESTLALGSPSSVSSSEYEDSELNEKVDLISTSLGTKPPLLPLREERLSLGVETVYKAKGVGWSCARKKSKKIKRDNLNEDRIMSFSEWILWNLTCGNMQFPLEEVSPKGNTTIENNSSKIRERLMKALTYEEYLEYLNRCQLKQKVGCQFEFLELESDQIVNEGREIPRKRLYPSQLTVDKRDERLLSPTSLKHAPNLSITESRLDSMLMERKVSPNKQVSKRRVSFSSTDEAVPISKANEEAQCFLPTKECLDQQGDNSTRNVTEGKPPTLHEESISGDTNTIQRQKQVRVPSTMESASHLPHHQVSQWQIRNSEDRDDLVSHVRGRHTEIRDYRTYQTSNQLESKLQDNNRGIRVKEPSSQYENQGKDDESKNTKEENIPLTLSKETIARNQGGFKDAIEIENKGIREFNSPWNKKKNVCTSIIFEDEKIKREQHSLVLAERIMKDLGFGEENKSSEEDAPVDNMDESDSNEGDESIDNEQKKSKVLTNRIMNQLGFGDIVNQRKEAGSPTPPHLKELPQGYRKELELTDEQKKFFFKRLGYIPTARGKRSRGQSSRSNLGSGSKQVSTSEGDDRSTSSYCPNGKKKSRVRICKKTTL